MSIFEARKDLPNTGNSFSLTILKKVSYEFYYEDYVIVISQVITHTEI